MAKRTRTPRDLTLEEWAKFQKEFRLTPNTADCFRIDGTPYSTARHYGGFRHNGNLYTVFYFAVADGNSPVKDNTTVYGPMIGVSQRMLAWVSKRLKKESEEAK